MNKEKRRYGRFRLIDFFVIAFCLSVAGCILNLFRLDLFSTITQHNEEPVGIIIIRNNVVQRRLANRALWDRPAVHSPVFLGDLIRVAELSSATLYIDGTHINLNENTLIRIQRSSDEEALFQFYIALDEGSLSLNTGEYAENIVLNLMGRQVEARAGTVLNAATGTEGIVLAVSEGEALFINAEEGETREVFSGEMIAFDIEGAERIEPAAVVISPPPHARFLNSIRSPLPVNFAWNRLHLQPYELLRLEIAEDRNFNRVIYVIGNLDDSVQAALGTGLWHWRLFFEDAVLSAGQITVTEAVRPELVRPIPASTYRFTEDLPAIRFQWSEIEGALSYIFVASLTPDFTGPQIVRQTGTASFVDSTMEAGTWFWRVMPVFPSVYQGSAVFSPTSFFRIEQNIREIAELPHPEGPIVIDTLQPVEIALRLPYRGATMSPPPGSAQRQIVFTWDSSGEEVRSRFILSRNSNPFSGTPAVDITDPPYRTVRLDNLEQGRWYWTVEAQAASGLVSAAEVRQFNVTHIPLAINLQFPVRGMTLARQAALRQPTVFTWNSNGEEVHSRFILSRNSNPLVGTPAVDITNPLNRTVRLDSLEEGIWYWTVQARGANGLVSVAEIRQLNVAAIPVTLSLQSPAQDATLAGLMALQQPTVFTWNSNGEEVRSRFILSRNSDPLVGVPAVEIADPPNRTVFMDNLEQGNWYWTVQMLCANGLVTTAETRLLEVLPIPVLPAPGNGAGMEQEITAEIHLAGVTHTPAVGLQSPAQGTALAGLTALQQPTVFTWNSNKEEVRSRFILSRNSNPLIGIPEVEIADPPNHTVRLETLEQGRWYWTVQAVGTNGLVTTAEIWLLEVLPIPVLPAPENLQPVQGYRIGIEQLENQGTMAFNWEAVPGANAYFFTLYHQTSNGRRLIQRSVAAAGTSWTLNDISVLDYGTFVWQVEAVHLAENNAIEQRGVISENSFVIYF